VWLRGAQHPLHSHSARTLIDHVAYVVMVNIPDCDSGDSGSIPDLRPNDGFPLASGVAIVFRVEGRKVRQRFVTPRLAGSIPAQPTVSECENPV
jgi:hypothetical protein